jgi:mono/diheme cytochrome c family protein
MTPDQTERHVVFASTILLPLFAGLMFFVVSIAQANAAPDRAADSATFRTKCAMCHGPDGSGSEVGKSMHVPDLRSPEVQKLPDAQLAQIISDGKGGMPPFKNSLSADQVHSLVAYIRSLRGKKQSGLGSGVTHGLFGMAWFSAVLQRGSSLSAEALMDDIFNGAANFSN